ncbi:MAG: GNAT family N-acetyltransferase [Clostridia bacterium]|nr:GNAT family N-acetyltransferase [Clostridia bacterium]
MDIKIVPCEEKHIDEAIKLTYAAWQPIFDGYKKALGEKMFNEYYSDWKETKYKRVYEGLLSERGYVALIENKVAGFIFYIVDEGTKTGIVEENAVSTEFRGLGIAQKMYDFVFDKMRSEGMVYSMVGTGLDDAHAPARRAYEKAGFNKSISSIRYYKEL